MSAGLQRSSRLRLGLSVSDLIPGLQHLLFPPDKSPFLAWAAVLSLGTGKAAQMQASGWWLPGTREQSRDLLLSLDRSRLFHHLCLPRDCETS